MPDRVLDLTAFTVLDLTDHSGQFAGKLLADVGLEVIKIEPPDGDPLRVRGPFAGVETDPDCSLPFLYLNANKKSIALDLESSADQARLRALASHSDVLLESFPPGYMSARRLDYDSLAEANPGLVVASITYFGQSGPYASYRGSDLVAQAMSGLLYVFGSAERPPCSAPETQALYTAGAYAALGTLVALQHRERSGRGQHVDVSAQEALAVEDQVLSSFANQGIVMRRDGAQHKQMSPANVFPCRDGFVYLFVSAGPHWRTFLALWPDHPPEFEDPVWESAAHRRTHAARITTAVEDLTRTYARAAFIELMQSHGIPCLPVNTPLEFLRDEQVQARGFLQPVRHPRVGVYQHPGPGFLVDGRRPFVRPAPALGEHRERAEALIKEARVPSAAPAAAAATTQALAGLRVLAFTQGLAGPWAGCLLAAHGAEVIKVESSRALDTLRRFGSPQAPTRFLEYNRNVLSIALNLKHPRGPALAKALAAQCDVVIENFSVSVLPKFGLDYADLAAVKPDLIMLRMPGFGTTGPKRQWESWGQTLNAFAGLLHLWRYPDEATPAGSQTPLADYMGPVVGLCAVLAAVLDRQRTGRGHFIDLSQAETLGSFMGVTYLQALFSGCDPQPAGNRSPFVAFQGCFPCRGEDRWCTITVETFLQWKGLVNVIGRPDLATEAEFTLAKNEPARSVIESAIAMWTRQREPVEAMRQLQEAAVPCGAVQSGEDLLNDPHLRARGFHVEIEHPALGRLIYPNVPFRLSATPGTPTRLAPELGQHTAEVLQRLLGVSREQVEALRDDEVLI